MDIQKKLDQACEYSLEIDLIDRRISHLIDLGNVLVNDPKINIDMILETKPKNGSQPFVVPLYSKADIMPYLANDSEIEPAIKVGNQRYYSACDIKNEEIVSTCIFLESTLALSVIEKLIVRLKQRKQDILIESKKIIKAGR